MKEGQPLISNPSSVPALGDVLDFMRVLWALDHALNRTSKRMKALLGVTGPQRLVIRIVGRFPGIPPGHLARLLHIHASTLTGVLKRLERQRLVHRRPDPRDGRRLLLSLTDKGRLFDVEAEGTVEAGIRNALEQMGPNEISAACKVMTSITNTLAKEVSTAEEAAAEARRRCGSGARARK